VRLFQCHRVSQGRNRLLSEARHRSQTDHAHTRNSTWIRGCRMTKPSKRQLCGDEVNRLLDTIDALKSELAEANNRAEHWRKLSVEIAKKVSDPSPCVEVQKSVAEALEKAALASCWRCREVDKWEPIAADGTHENRHARQYHEWCDARAIRALIPPVSKER
jgi:hypothetical protein